MTSVKTVLKVSTIIVAFLFISGYSLYESRNIIRGPILKIFEPTDGSAIESPIVEVKGMAQNISSIRINDRAITTDIEGVFNEKLLLSPGYNIIKLSAEDKFGRKTEKILELVFNQNKSLGLIKSQKIN
jgi:hypothetical protein